MAGPRTATTSPHHRRDGQRHRIGVADGEGLGQDFGEDQHHHRHHRGDVGDAGLAGQGDGDAGGQRRGQDVDQGVAQQDRAQQPLLAPVAGD